MQRLKLFFLAIVGVFLSVSAFGSHMIGGDISYKCLGNNKFQITLTLFQDCLNGQPLAIQQDDPAYYAIYTQGSNPVLVNQGSVPSTVTIPRVNPNFSNDCISNYPETCMREQIFVFTVTLPSTTQGYTIVYQRCCRNAAITNVQNPGNIGVTYSAEIPPFQPGECPNNSATFNSLPPQIICVNNPFSYDFSATDPDGDSLSYELCDAHPGGSPMDARPEGNEITPPPFPSVPYAPPYTAQQPIPGVPPITINPVTGLMTGVPTQTGRFIVTVCCHEWRNGQIINTLSRDVQFVITDCSKNVIADMPHIARNPKVYSIVCDGYTVHFDNTSTGGSNYYWQFGLPNATSTQFEPTYTYPDTGVYNVKLVVNRGSTCSDSIEKLVKIYPYFHVGFTYSGKLCAGQPIQFTDTSTATYPPIISRQWYFGDGSATTSQQNPTHTFAAPGGTKTVKLVAQTQIGCRDSSSVEVPIDYLNVFAGNDTIIVKDHPMQLHGTGSQSYQWTPTQYLSNPNISNPIADFPDTGKYVYVLTGTTEHHCVASDSITIWVVSRGSIFVPTGFTPNGDGLNDFLQPIIIGFTSIDYFRIFNRYGQLVFSSSRNNKPKWDGTFHGKPCAMGTYFWEIKATNVDGKKEIKKGDVTLIR